MPVRANLLLKRNIKAILRARGQSQKDLADWCRRSESWLSKALDEQLEHRELPLKYWDRVADFFGISTYQLLQPGVHPATERRRGVERRTGRDRRVNQVAADRVLGGGSRTAIAALLEEDELQLIRKYRKLSAGEREHLQTAGSFARDPRSAAAKIKPRRASPEAKDRSENAARPKHDDDRGENRA